MIDYHNLEKEIIRLLSKKKAKYVVKESRRGRTYTLASSHGNLEVTIGTEWLGYEYTMAGGYLGRTVGLSEDTDGYELEFNVNVTNEIASETLAIVEAFVSRKILKRIESDCLKLAFLLSPNKYLLKTFTPKRKWWKFDSSTTEIVNRNGLAKSGFKPY